MEYEINQNHCISHLNLEFNYDIVTKNEERLKNLDNLTLPLEKELELLHELANFELGKFLLVNKGLNGYWTQYIILGDHSNLNQNSLEYWIINNAPIVKATQERFKIFQNEIKSKIHSDMSLASIPCGLMDDLLTINYDNFENIKLTGIDIDKKSLTLAKENAVNHKINNVNFLHKDAWNLNQFNQYDLVTSNGLNIYESNEEFVIQLYKNLNYSLKPDGWFITSFLTLPFNSKGNCNWKNCNIEDLKLQKALFVDILQAGWQIFRDEDQMYDSLGKAGFRVIDIIYDSQNIFPTIISKKI